MREVPETRGTLLRSMIWDNQLRRSGEECVGLTLRVSSNLGWRDC
jgi:hypothetical protein